MKLRMVVVSAFVSVETWSEPHVRMVLLQVITPVKQVPASLSSLPIAALVLERTLPPAILARSSLCKCLTPVPILGLKLVVSIRSTCR